MRKSIMLTLLLLVLSIGILFFVFDWVNEKKESVSVEETVLAGDKAAAGGITVTNRTTCEEHLFWDTVYQVGNELDVKTKFTFCQTRKQDSGEATPEVYLYFNSSYGFSGNALDLEKKNEYSYMAIKPAIDVSKRTPDGETREETLCLKDYYEYYPLTMDLLIPGAEFEMNKDLRQNLEDYFRIKVPGEHKIKVSVTKDSDGNITNVDSSSIAGETLFFCAGTVSDSGCYVAMTLADGDTGESKPLPKEVSGIHYLPFEENEGVIHPVTQEMKRVYAFENEMIRPLRLLQASDGRLLLFTGEDKSVTLSVIDSETMALVQKLELTIETADVELIEIKQYDNMIVPVFSDGSFYLLQDNVDGTYDIKMTGSLFACEKIGQELSIVNHNMMMDYDGGRLAVAFYQPSSFNTCSTYLMVYKQDALAYAGKYDLSCDRTVPGEQGNSTKAVHPLNFKPLRVSCG